MKTASIRFRPPHLGGHIHMYTGIQTIHTHTERHTTRKDTPKQEWCYTTVIIELGKLRLKMMSSRLA